MKKLISMLSIAAVAIALLGLTNCRPQQPRDFSVVIFSIVEIEPIAQLRKGFRDEFEKSDFARTRKVVITEQNAQGDQGLVNQIADKLAAEKPDLVYVLGTPAAQAVQKRSPDTLLLQGAVTDPIAAGLATSWDGSGKKYVATSDLPSVPKQISLISELTPQATRLGILYNPGEANSVAVVSRVKEHIEKNRLNLRLVERPIANSSEVATAMQSLIGNIDAIYLPPDNTAHAAIPVIGKFAKENKIPFYATVDNALKEGAVATLSLDFYQLGQESAKLALKVVAGQAPETTPIQISENPTISISATTAKALGIDVSQFRNKPNVKIVE